MSFRAAKTVEESPDCRIPRLRIRNELDVSIGIFGATGSGGGIDPRRRRTGGASLSRGGGGFIPTATSTLQAGDYLILMIAKEGLDLVDQLIGAEDPHA